MKPERIKSIEHLKSVLKDGESHEFFILLKGGLRSSKLISYDEESTFYVYNISDDTEQELTEAELMNRDYTNVGYALEKGALYWEWEDDGELKEGDKVLWADPQGTPDDDRVWKVEKISDEVVFITSGTPGQPGYSEAEVPPYEIIRLTPNF